MALGLLAVVATLSDGSIVPGATYTITEHGTSTEPQLYSTSTGEGSVDNPGVVGSDGLILGYVEEGEYDVDVDLPGYTGVEQVTVVAIPTSVQQSSYSTTVTGPLAKSIREAIIADPGTQFSDS